MMEKREKNKKFFYSEFGRDLEEIKKKILLGDFWGKCGAVSLQQQIVNFYRAYCRWDKIYYGNKLSIFPVELFSMSSSTYYAASGNAFSHIWQANLFLKPLWLWRAWRCMRTAKKYSDKFASLKKIEDMTLGELDVRACVLDKAGRRDEAAGLLSHGIMRILTKQVGTKHDLCLFLIHEAEIYGKMKKIGEAEENYQQAIKLLEDEAIPVLTKVRVMKSYGKFLISFGRVCEARSFLNKARFLAEEKELVDQVVKIMALIDVCI